MRHNFPDVKLELELIQPKINESFLVRRYLRSEQADQRYPWHYHEEIEIMYIHGGEGTRFIGNNMSMFKQGDLVLIGPNLPHSGSVDNITKNDYQILVYFKPELFNSLFFNLPETKHINEVLRMSSQGIAIRGADKKRIGDKATALLELTGIKRLLLLTEILNDIYLSEDKIILNEPSKMLNQNLPHEQRISKVYNYIQKNYSDKINIADISTLVGMTESAFCRYFKKYTGKTFTHYLNEYRIMNANRLIRETDLSISDIAYQSGFNNLSYFHRTFKKSVGKSPLVQKNHGK